MTQRFDTTIEVGMRPDGAPWRIPMIELRGSRPGPSTAMVAGIWGDKPLAIMTLWDLIEELRDADLRGRVWIVPSANPPAIAAGTRVNPDGVALNRVFPGSPTGALTQQIAHVLFHEIMQRCDCVVDLHSGTATMGLGYVYDYGDLELSASFGYLPVVPGFAQPGQLSQAVVEAGATSCLIEFGGGEDRDRARGLAGCLNVLAHRGHVDRTVTGPGEVPLVERVSMYMPSVGGVLGATMTTGMIGAPVPPGPAAWVDCPGTGERLDTFDVDEPDGILLLATITPLLIEPGAFALTVGHGTHRLGVPGRHI